MEVVYKKTAQDRLVAILLQLLEINGCDIFNKIHYVRVTQDEMDALSNSSGFNRVKEFSKCVYLRPDLTTSYVVDVKFKVEE